MKIIVTGSVGTGKSSLSKKLSKKLDYPHIELNKAIHKEKLYEKYDKKSKSYIVDQKKLNQYITKISKNHTNLIIDSHLIQFLNKKFVDLCIVCKCDLKVLKKRLEKRNYSKSKIRENLDAEIFDVCLTEALEKRYNIMIIDTTKKVSLQPIIKMIK